MQSSGSSSTHCRSEIRRMIMRGELLPGEKVAQHDLAERLGVSRIPLREALSMLAAEGTLTHRPNSGYQVARFNRTDLEELYLMRRLLENELLRTAPLGPSMADEMLRLDEELRTLDTQKDLERYQQVNQSFHFVPFDASPLRLVRDEVARLWDRTNFHRALFLHETAAAHSIAAHHDQIVEAVRTADVERLIAVSEEHRRVTETALDARFRAS